MCSMKKKKMCSLIIYVIQGPLHIVRTTIYIFLFPLIISHSSLHIANTQLMFAELMNIIVIILKSFL